MGAIKRTAFEDQKDASQQLRGTISLELVDSADHFGDWCQRLGAERLQRLLDKPGVNSLLSAHYKRQKSA